MEEGLVVFEAGFKEIELSNCWVLKRVIEYTLALGNILNGGTDKGQADGFNFESIDKIFNIKDVNGKPAAFFICQELVKENPDCINYKQKLVNFYATKRYGWENLFPGFETYLWSCESMYQKAKALADKIDDETDEFKMKAPIEMNQVVKSVTDIMDWYKAVKKQWERYCKYFDFNDEKKDESQKFTKWFIEFFDTLDKYFPKQKKK